MKEMDLESVIKLGRYATDLDYKDETIENLEAIVEMIQNYA